MFCHVFAELIGLPHADVWVTSSNVKRCIILLLAASALNVPAAPAENEPEANKKAVDMLRETIYQYERRRGSLLPPPTATTNLGPARSTNAGVARVVPTRPPPSSPPPAATVKPSPRSSPAPIISPPESPLPAGASNMRETSLAELERLYLDGKITAKQFQKYLREHEERTATAKASPPVVASKPSSPPQKPPVQTPRATERKPTPPPTAPEPASGDQAAISEVEKKMDELLRLKAAREQANTNAANNAASSNAPKTKRQKLDDLLKQLIDGKISDAEYKERREKVIAEPDPK